MSNQIILDKSGHVATLTLNQPEKLNALSSQLRTEMHAAAENMEFERAATLRDQIRGIRKRALGVVESS